MSFDAEDVIELLLSGFPFSGCICPKRKLDVDSIYAAALAGKSLKDARAPSSLSYVVNHRAAQNVVVERNFCNLKGIGMAVTLIRRDVVERMVAAGAVSTMPIEHGAETDSFRQSLSPRLLRPHPGQRAPGLSR